MHEKKKKKKKEENAARAGVIHVNIVNSIEGGRWHEELEALGLWTFTASGDRSAAEASDLGSSMESSSGTSSQATPAASSLVTIGPGLPALPKKIVEKMLSGVYVEFAELPPAKGKGWSTPQVAEGQIVIMQAADMLPNKKAIPDLATWLQCFRLHVAVIASRQPNQVPDLMAISPDCEG